MNSEAEKWTREKHFNWDSKEEDTNPDPFPPPFHKKKQENHDEHNILLATVKYTKATSTLKEMNKMLLPTHLGYHPEAGPETTDVAILRSRLRATRHNGHEWLSVLLVWEL